MGSKNRFYMDMQTLNSGVTGSLHFGIANYPDFTTTRFAVDCGLFQGKDETGSENKTLPFNADSLEFVLITHNHIDHVGRLPLLCKQGFRGNIYASPPTCELIVEALEDSYKVLKDSSKKRHEAILYTEDDIAQALSQVKPIPFGEKLQIDEHIAVSFFINGHLPGAALILVEISYPGEQPINWLFTGDYNDKNMFFDVPPLPERVLDLPLNVMIESTYGNMDSTEITPCFEKNILAALEHNATIVVPVFSLGRSQEILYVLKRLQDTGKLSKEIPIYFDGKLAHRYTRLYLDGKLGLREDILDFLPHGLVYVNTENRKQVLEDTNTKIILTSSGMGSYGPAPRYIATFLKQKNALIHFSGYTAEGTLGSKLKQTPIGEEVSFGGLREVTKYAQVESTTEFSAHAKADVLIAFLQQFTHLNLVLVNHGEEETKEIFAKRVSKFVKTKDVGIANRETFFRVSPYHLIKTMTTKFQ